MSQPTSSLMNSLAELLPTIPRTPANGLHLDLLVELVEAVASAPSNRKTGTLRDLVPRIVLLLKQLQSDPEPDDDDPVTELLRSMKR